MFYVIWLAFLFLVTFIVFLGFNLFTVGITVESIKKSLVNSLCSILAAIAIGILFFKSFELALFINEHYPMWGGTA